MNDIAVRDEEKDNRYVAERDGEMLGFAGYTRTEGVTTFTHTVVHPENEGQGVGSTLISGALDAERAAGRSIVPVCPFVVAYVKRHPEYADLVS
ncbi:GNAT family N-acetyltransferase [Pseudactinotalea sp.]|uniref:GNAT family N-acetyltransferase n=1 Tax=Pseudactinotalea sp. TaxID=1926260 RepID=UPI003B3AA137